MFVFVPAGRICASPGDGLVLLGDGALGVDELFPQLSVGDVQAVYLLAKVVALLLQLLA